MAIEAMPNEAIAAPGGAGIQAAQTVVNKGVDVLISGNIGPNAFQVLSAAGVKVVTGAYGTVKEAVEMYKNGKLNETGVSTVAAHAGMGMGGGRGGGRGMGFDMQQQPIPSRPQAQQAQQAPHAPVTPKTKEEELEQLSDMASRLEKELGEVKKRIEELKRG